MKDDTTFMKTWERATTVLEEAERGLFRIAAEAGEARAYGEAAALMEVARRIQEIAKLMVPGWPGFESESGGGSAYAGPKGSAPASSVLSVRLRSRKRARRSPYPQFFRDGDSLIKVGWSKAEGTAYEHKCPKRIIDILANECARVNGSGKRFTMDKILPLRGPDSGGDLPSYQAYVALAFLRHADLIQQHGRSGYSIPKPKTFIIDVATAWVRSKTR